MEYKLLISERASKEIENAFDYYLKINRTIGDKFLLNLEKTFQSLEHNQNYKKRYKNIRSIKIYKFPYSIYFYTDEEKGIVKILACFHQKLNPKKRP